MSSATNKEPPKIVLGVDLGAVNTRAAAIRNSTVQIIVDSEGNSAFPTHDIYRFRSHLNESEAAFALDQWPPEAYILQYLKSLTSAQFDDAAIKHAVIAVPPKASDSYRQRLKYISSLVGLEVLRIINAPSAACVAHELDKVIETKKALVFDVGGSAFSVSVFEIEEGILDILITEEDTTLAQILSDPVATKNAGQGSGVIHKTHQDSSSGSNTRLGQSFSQELYELGACDVLQKIQVYVKQVLGQVHARLDDINYVIVTGESSSDDLVQQLVFNTFNKEPLRLPNGDQRDAVARGAAIQGDVLINTSFGPADFMCSLAFVAPVHIGIETRGGLFYEIMRRNSLPGRRSRVFISMNESRGPIQIRVFDGVRRLVEYNRFLGKIELADVDPNTRITVAVDWSVEDLGITVFATNESSDEVQTFRVPQYMDLGSQEVDRVFKEREQCAETHNINSRLTELLEYVKLQKISLRAADTPDSETYAVSIEELSRIEEWGNKKGTDLELDELEEKFGQARLWVEGNRFCLPAPIGD